MTIRMRKWRWLQERVPLVRYAKRVRWKLRELYYRRFGVMHLRRAVRTTQRPRLVIGSQQKHDFGWIPTEKNFLNLVYPEDWARFFEPDSVRAIMAEHVWEHLAADEARTAARICHTYLRSGGYLRCAVPDGLHPDPAYRALVDVRAEDLYPNEHQVLYTYQTARALFEWAGFTVNLLEYFDEAGTFHEHPWSEAQGTIWRSRRHDRRNRGGGLVYTSIILDAVKP